MDNDENFFEEKIEKELEYSLMELDKELETLTSEEKNDIIKMKTKIEIFNKEIINNQETIIKEFKFQLENLQTMLQQQIELAEDYEKLLIVKNDIIKNLEQIIEIQNKKEGEQ